MKNATIAATSETPITHAGTAIAPSPKCQALTKERWLEARKAELLPVVYYHSVFTLPHLLNPVILCNKKVMLKNLFTSASDALLEFGANNLGGKLGIISVLHTWDQVLNDHFHLRKEKRK